MAITQNYIKWESGESCGFRIFFPDFFAANFVVVEGIFFPSIVGERGGYAIAISWQVLISWDSCSTCSFDLVTWTSSSRIYSGINSSCRALVVISSSPDGSI